MTQTNRTGLYCLTLIALLSMAAMWSLSQLSTHRSNATEASVQLATSQQLIARIKQLQTRPSLAGAQEMQLTDLAQLIEQAAHAAGLDRQQLVRIWPEPARRVDDSPYKQKPTQILLQDISLQQLVQFLHRLTTEGQLTATSLRLAIPRGESSVNPNLNRNAKPVKSAGTANRWSVEVTVSYLIYAPPAGTTAATTLVQTDQAP